MGGVLQLPAALVALVLGYPGGLFRPALGAEFALVHRAAGAGPAVRLRLWLLRTALRQNFPAAAAPHFGHVQLSPAGFGSGFLLPQLGQKLPVMPL